MFTRCPHCGTFFRISADDIKVAQGRVRCGQCEKVFNSLDHLLENLSAADSLNMSAIADNNIDTTGLEVSPLEDILKDNPLPEISATDLSEVASTESDMGMAEEIESELMRAERYHYPSGMFSSVMWISGLVTLMIFIAIQYAHFYPDQLSQYPQTRPWMETLCAITGCKLPLQEDIKAIALVNRDIHSHTKIKNALMINATLLNKANFYQPYPIMQVTLSDINGKTVAMRRFEPDEYLSEKPNLKKGIKPATPIKVNLIVKDPGREAVNFEFEFFHMRTGPKEKSDSKA